MRIEAIKAAAFGPFSGDLLELTPGMNVVYGPNESGKSSWHAALYAALCGMKKSRGQPTREDRAFASRHRPWQGAAWRVAVVISLDDGRTIEIEQSFGAGGRSVATERGSKRPLTGDIVRAGTVDASTFLGLTRETALATLFVRQADMLRVLADAGALQEYLERAAATNTVDTTADQALARIAAYKRDRVGVLRTGARGPLATAARRLKEAGETLDMAEERFEGYQELLARRHAVDYELRDVEQRLRCVVDHENERQRHERWKVIHLAERRLDQARQLAAEAAAGPQGEGPAKELVTALTRVLAAFEARPDVPEPLQGPSADELERDLDDVPEAPDGDVEPAADVTTRRDGWHRKAQQLATHADSRPDPPEGSEETPERNGSAAALEAELTALPDMPAGDLEPAPEVTTTREAWHREAQLLAAHDNNQPDPLTGVDAFPDADPDASAIEAELAALPDMPVGDVEAAAEVTACRDSWHQEVQELVAHDKNRPGGSELENLVGQGSPNAAEIEVELAGLPDLPTGDIEPAPEVTTCRESWQRAVQLLASHDGNSPGGSAVEDRSGQGGPSVAEIEVEVANLPDVPTGDVEPALEVTTCREAWQREAQRLAAHNDNRPNDAVLPVLPVPPQELRRLADEVEASVPVIDPKLQEDVRQRQAWVTKPAPDRQTTVEQPRAGAARSPGIRVATSVGPVLVVLGVAVLAVGQPIPAGVLVLIGLILIGAAMSAARRRDPVTNEPPLPLARATPAPDVELQRLEARLLLEEEALSQATRRRDSAHARLAELNLPFDAVELRTLAGNHDARAFEHDRVAQWESRRVELEGQAEAAEQRLRGVLADHGTAVADDEALDQAFHRYNDACRQRAQQAAQAARRPDLEARLQERRAAESARGAAIERVAEWERRRVGLASGAASAKQDLLAALTNRGASVTGEENLDQALRRYTEACRQRGQQAALAARRPDLEARLQERRAAESARGAAIERLAQWERRRVQLEGRAAAAEHEVRAVLAAHGSPVADDEEVDHAVRRYADVCRQRAQQAAQAARRSDLEARLRERRAAESGHRTSVDRIAEWERRRVELSGQAAAAEQLFRALLGGHGTAVANEDDLDQAFQRYVAACRERAQMAALATRRSDLEARLRERRAAEAAHRASVDRVAEWERRRAELEGEEAAAEQELRGILADHGTAVADEETLEQAFQRYAEACRQRAQQAAQAARRSDLVARLRERRAAESSRANDLEARTNAEQHLRPAAAAAGLPDAEDSEQLVSSMRDWLARQEVLEIERLRTAERTARLDQLLDGRTIEELESETAALIAEAGDPPDEASPMKDRSVELEVLETDLRQRRDTLAELVGQLEGAEGHLLDVSRAVEAEAQARADVNRLTSLAEDLDLASEILTAAQEKVHADIAPVLNETIRPWVARITSGRYDDIRVDPATLEVQAHETTGQFRSATVLSHGTTEQLFLLLRLALAQRLTTTGEKAPVILDDVTVQSDADRTVAMLELLHELSADHQIVLFSQEDEVLRWAEAQLRPPSDRLIQLAART